MPRFSHQFTVSWVETDALAVVHFSNYFRYFERAEQEFYGSSGATQGNVMERYGVAFPRVEAHCEYESPMRFGDSGRTDLSLVEIKDKSVKIRFEITNITTGKLSAHGSMTLVCVDTTTWKAVTIPQDLREILGKLG